MVPCAGLRTAAFLHEEHFNAVDNEYCPIPLSRATKESYTEKCKIA